MGDVSVPQPNQAQNNVPEMMPNNGQQQEAMPPLDDLGQENMEGMENDNPNKEKKEIQKNIGKGCADFREYQGQDKEDLQKWIEGMLNSITDDSEDVDTEEDTHEMNSSEPEMPMESFIFKKGQLNKINEIFGTDDGKKNNKKTEKKITKNNTSPFNNPQLN